MFTSLITKDPFKASISPKIYSSIFLSIQFMGIGFNIGTAT